jgi:hypothetical protein
LPEVGLKDLCFELACQSAERFLDLQWSDGRFSSQPEHETDEWDFYDQRGRGRGSAAAAGRACGAYEQWVLFRLEAGG